MSAERAGVLFVDDEERILRSLRMLFRGRHDVHTTTSGREALALVRKQPVHVIVSDQRMPEMTGVELLQQVRVASPATMRVLLTGYSDLAAITSSVNDGEIFRFIEKPWQSQHLIDVVAEASEIGVASFAANALAARAPTEPKPELTVLVLDGERETAALVREMSTRLSVQHVSDVESALEFLSTQRVAVIIADVRHAQDDVAGALKVLKRASPATLTIAVSTLRDARALIDLINQGQIYRFLPKPLSKELLRRSLHSAFDHYAHLQASPILVRRHSVEQAKFEPVSLSARLMGYWRRIRETNRTQPGM